MEARATHRQCGLGASKNNGTYDLSSSQERCLGLPLELPTVVATVGAVEPVPVGLVLDEAVVLVALCASRGDGSVHLLVPAHSAEPLDSLGCVWLGAIAVSVAPGTAPATS